MSEIQRTNEHDYVWEARKYPGVSKILQGAGLIDFSGIPEHILERARDFGQAVHRATELYDRQDLDMKSLSDPLVPFLDGWIKFKKDYGAEVVESELVVCSKTWGFGGTLDRILRIKGDLILPDIKSTRTIAPAGKLQLSAYKIGYEERTGKKIKARWTVQLTGDAIGYRVVPYKNDREDQDDFLSALKVYNWKKREGLL